MTRQRRTTEQVGSHHLSSALLCSQATQLNLNLSTIFYTYFLCLPYVPFTMSPSKLGLFASLALAANAVLIPPSVAIAELGDDNALETLAINPFKRTVAVECPRCAVATLDGETLKWNKDAGNAFVSTPSPQPLLHSPLAASRRLHDAHHIWTSRNLYILTHCSFLTSKLGLVKTRSRLMAFSYILRVLPWRRSLSISLRSTLRLRTTCAFASLDTPSTSTRQRPCQRPELSYFP